MSRFERAAAARILARYKRAVLLGRSELPIDVARRLIGPDCAYHLYGRPAAAKGAAARPSRDPAVG